MAGLKDVIAKFYLERLPRFRKPRVTRDSKGNILKVSDVDNMGPKIRVSFLDKGGNPLIWSGQYGKGFDLEGVPGLFEWKHGILPQLLREGVFAEAPTYQGVINRPLSSTDDPETLAERNAFRSAQFTDILNSDKWDFNPFFSRFIPGGKVLVMKQRPVEYKKGDVRLNESGLPESTGEGESSQYMEPILEWNEKRHRMEPIMVPKRLILPMDLYDLGSDFWQGQLKKIKEKGSEYGFAGAARAMNERAKDIGSRMIKIKSPFIRNRKDPEEQGEYYWFAPEDIELMGEPTIKAMLDAYVRGERPSGRTGEMWASVLPGAWPGGAFNDNLKNRYYELRKKLDNEGWELSPEEKEAVEKQNAELNIKNKLQAGERIVDGLNANKQKLKREILRAMKREIGRGKGGPGGTALDKRLMDEWGEHYGTADIKGNVVMNERFMDEWANPNFDASAVDKMRNYLKAHGLDASNTMDIFKPGSSGYNTILDDMVEEAMLHSGGERKKARKDWGVDEANKKKVIVTKDDDGSPVAGTLASLSAGPNKIGSDKKGDSGLTESEYEEKRRKARGES